MTVEENVNRTKKIYHFTIPDGCEKTGTSAEANKQKYSKSKFPTITQDGSPKIKVLESSFEPNRSSRVCLEHFTDGKNFYMLFFWPKTHKNSE